MKTTFSYKMPAAELLGTDRAANITFFLLENGQNVWGKWRGSMRAADQRKIFGMVAGRGQIWIDGTEEKVGHNVSVCFGTMRETVWQASYSDLNAGRDPYAIGSHERLCSGGF
jgi:hypothetical protein